MFICMYNNSSFIDINLFTKKRFFKINIQNKNIQYIIFARKQNNQKHQNNSIYTQ